MLFSSPLPKNSAMTLKPSALLRSCVKNLSCIKRVAVGARGKRAFHGEVEVSGT